MRKSLLLVSIICLIGLTSINAQLNQGNIMAGLSTTFSGNSWYSEGLNPGAGLFNLGFSTVKDLDDDEIDAKFAAFNFQPRIGYFVIDNLAIGLDLMAGIVREKDPEDSDTWTVTTLGAGPFVRYYYPMEKIYPFAELNVGFGSTKYKSEYGEEYSYESKYTNFVYSAGIGAAIPLGERVTFDALAGYMSSTMKEKDEEYSDETRIGTFGIKMGFMVYFGATE